MSLNDERGSVNGVIQSKAFNSYLYVVDLHSSQFSLKDPEKERSIIETIIS